MTWLKTVWAEIIGLFVDDASLAIAIAVWLAVAWLLFRVGVVAPAWRGPLLFLGLAALFVENTLRRARR